MKYYGKVTGLRTQETWNTHRIRWFDVETQIEVVDLAADVEEKKETTTKVNLVLDDPSLLPRLGDLVELDVTFKSVDIDRVEPSVEDNEENDNTMSQGDPFYDEIKQGG